MNRLIKTILCITAACVGIGCAALVLSFALGGGRLDFGSGNPLYLAKQKVGSILSEIRDRMHRPDFSQAAVVENDECVITDWGDSGDLAEAEAMEGYAEQEFLEEDSYEGDELIYCGPASQIKSLDIDLRYGSLELLESDDSNIRVSVSGQAHHILAESGNGGLTVNDSRKGSKSRDDAYVYLEIPEDMQFTTVTVCTDAGTVDTDCSFRAKQLTITANAGAVTLDEVKSDEFTATIGAGTIDVSDATFGRMDLECGVGTAYIEGGIQQDSSISCGMGTVELELEDGEDSFNYMISCGMGCVDIGDNSYSALSQKRRIDNGASATLSLDCGMGQIMVE